MSTGSHNPFSGSTTNLIVTMTVVVLTTLIRVEADLGGLPRDCQLNQVRENPRNPHSFYWCLSDGPVLMKCVDTFIFDVSAGKCVTPQESHKRRGDKLVNFQDHKNNKLSVGVQVASTTKNSSSSLAAKVASNKSPNCPAQDPLHTSVYFPGPDCHHYYQCDNGTPKLKECPSDLEWNPTLEVCDYPYRAGCSRPTATTVRSVVIPSSSSSKHQNLPLPPPLV